MLRYAIQGGCNVSDGSRVIYLCESLGEVIQSLCMFGGAILEFLFEFHIVYVLVYECAFRTVFYPL